MTLNTAIAIILLMGIANLVRDLRIDEGTLRRLNSEIIKYSAPSRDLQTIEAYKNKVNKASEEQVKTLSVAEEHLNSLNQDTTTELAKTLELAKFKEVEFRQKDNAIVTLTELFGLANGLSRTIDLSTIILPGNNTNAQTITSSSIKLFQQVLKKIHELIDPAIKAGTI